MLVWSGEPKLDFEVAPPSIQVIGLQGHQLTDIAGECFIVFEYRPHTMFGEFISRKEVLVWAGGTETRFRECPA